MANKLLVVCFLALCVYASAALRDRDRSARIRPRRPARTTTTTTTTTTTPPSPEALRESSIASRKASSRAASAARRAGARLQAALTGTRHAPSPIKVIIPPRQASAGKGQTALSITLPDGTQVSAFQDVFWYNGFRYAVCRTQQGDVFLPTDYYICCENAYFENFDPNDPKVCCGQDYYKPNSEICCDGFFYNKTDAHTGYPAQCCKDVYYVPELEVCCNGGYDDKFLYGCCNDQFYHKPSTECCAGVQHPLQPDFQCCHTYYGPSTFICCNNKPYHSFFYSCCHNTNQYIPSTHQCCPDGSVVPNGNSCFAGKR